MVIKIWTNMLFSIIVCRKQCQIIIFYVYCYQITWCRKTETPAQLGESDDDDLAGEDVGPAGDIGGGAADDDLSDEELPGVPSTSSASAEPVQKRARIRLPQAANKERTEWVWTHEDLPPKDMPISKVRPKNLDHCRTDVQTFLAVLGEDNIQLFTEQSNRFRVKNTNTVFHHFIWKLVSYCTYE